MGRTSEALERPDIDGLLAKEHHAVLEQRRADLGDLRGVHLSSEIDLADLGADVRRQRRHRNRLIESGSQGDLIDSSTHGINSPPLTCNACPVI
jgi:hypothetical protein